MTVLLREAIGERLRHARNNQRRTLREVSRSARVSLGYLSEVERGRKEASSELLAAICQALDLPLSELLQHVALDISTLDIGDHHEPIPAARPAGEQQPVTVPVPEVLVAEPAAGKLDGGTLPLGILGDQLPDLRIQPVLTHRLSTSITSGRGKMVVPA
jgi:transcriptional regulator with XRE-family HTH domain